MREFVILKHNHNSLIRFSIVILTLVLSLILAPSLQIGFPAALIPTGVAILGSVIHHIYHENYKEIGEFYFSESGISILDYASQTERLISVHELRRVLIQYEGYHGQEHQIHPWDIQTRTDFGDNNYIQIETSVERIRYCFYGNNSGDIKHMRKWSVYFADHGIEMKSSKYISFPPFVRRIFDKPLRP